MNSNPTNVPLYREEDFVYVNLNEKEIVDRVIWDAEGKAKIRPMPTPEEKVGHKKRQKNYPYCTFRTAQRILRKRKISDADTKPSLDEILTKATQEPFWD